VAFSVHCAVCAAAAAGGFPLRLVFSHAAYNEHNCRQEYRQYNNCSYVV